jgi:hypothetical protein
MSWGEDRWGTTCWGSSAHKPASYGWGELRWGAFTWGGEPDEDCVPPSCDLRHRDHCESDNNRFEVGRALDMAANLRGIGNRPLSHTPCDEQ